ncbi:MAG TPA: hypothetical protein VHX38_34160 [Pseudonocardiaceae bacterium]|jgi:hypothetical protein|nr:hypothetical protein [Pseudonocardiaceae bacterium]
MTETDDTAPGSPAQDADWDTSAPPGAKLAEELRLLLGVLAERAEPWLNRLATAPEGTADAAEHTPATCGWCPLCAGIAVLRGERPELAVRAAEHASGLLAVLRASLAERPSDASATPAAKPESAADPAAGAAESGPEAEPAPEPGRVQRIAIRRRGAGSRP